jgi:PAS domain S-box-containing protein
MVEKKLIGKVVLINVFLVTSITILSFLSHDENMWVKNTISTTLLITSIFTVYIAFRINKSFGKFNMQGFVKHIPVSFAITDINGKVEYVNKNFELLTGYKTDEVVGKNMNILQSGKTSQETYKDMWNTILKGKIWADEIWNRKKDGTCFYEKLKIAPVFERDKIVNFVAILENYTSEFTKISRIKETGEFMRNIMENIPLGVVLVDSENKIFQINKSASKILQFKNFREAQKGLIGTKCYDVLSEKGNRKKCVPNEGCEITKDLKITIEVNGNEINIVKNVFPLMLNEKPIHVEVFLDISETAKHELELERETKRANYMAQKSMEAEEGLKRYNENLEIMVKERTEELQKVITNLTEAQSKIVQSEKLVSIGQLAAGIAHEINTPIQYVGDNIRFFQEAFSEFLKVTEKYEKIPDFLSSDEADTKVMVDEIEKVLNLADLEYLKKELPEALTQSIEGVDRVAAIVRSMKEFSHPGISEKIEVDINSSIESTITVSRNEWKYVAEMKTILDRTIPLVPCLPGELNQVFLNIIINASHAIAEKVKESGDKGIICIETLKNKDFVEVRISDTGGGIPEKIQNKIFDPFFTTKEVGKGTGQGLSISYPVVVEKHGGELFFETEEGIGTTFIIKLPFRR